MRSAPHWRGLSIYARTFLLLGAVVTAADTLCFGFARLGPNGPPPIGPADFESNRQPPPRPPGDPGPPDAGGPPLSMGLGPRNGWTVASIVGLELLVMLPLGWLFASGLATPLRRLADTAKTVARDAVPSALVQEGPTEMSAAIVAFNAMQARLHRAIQERTQMVGAIAHDLRTPLTRLAFRLDDLPGTTGEHVRGDIEEMRAMISAALDFLRDRSAGRRAEKLDLRALVERVVEEQSDLGHDVVLTPGTNMTIEGDPLDLRRALGNLIDNAIKYGHRARVALIERSSECVLEVDDDGPGIPEALHAQVFDPFFRVEGSRNRDTGGIGLGLSAVRAVVIEHGGEVYLRNRNGGGLRATVRLPKSLIAD